MAVVPCSPYEPAAQLLRLFVGQPALVLKTLFCRTTPQQHDINSAVCRAGAEVGR